jgi:hypothetical protein
MAKKKTRRLQQLENLMRNLKKLEASLDQHLLDIEALEKRIEDFEKIESKSKDTKNKTYWDAYCKEHDKHLGKSKSKHKKSRPGNNLEGAVLDKLNM